MSSPHDQSYALAIRSAEAAYFGSERWTISALENELVYWSETCRVSGQTHTAVARCEVLTAILKQRKGKPMTQQLRTDQQKKVVDRLVKTFGIDGSKVLFLNADKPDEPWLRGKQLAAIARQSGLFKVIRAEHEKVVDVGSQRQVIYQGTVVDLDDRIYSLPGVATIGEKIAATDEDVNADDLAESRALRSSLEIAGFDPFDPNSVVPLGEFQTAATRDADVAKTESRRADIARAHIVARAKGLIVGKDFLGYRMFLKDHYNEDSMAGFDATQRKSLIEALERYEPPVPPEFADLDGPGSEAS
jgi:hypothetical protein